MPSQYEGRLRALNAQGMKDPQIATVLGCTTQYVHKLRTQLGIPRVSQKLVCPVCGSQFPKERGRATCGGECSRIHRERSATADSYRCTKCKQVLPREWFPKASSRRGVDCRCKRCKAEDARLYYLRQKNRSAEA